MKTTLKHMWKSSSLFRKTAHVDMLTPWYRVVSYIVPQCFSPNLLTQILAIGQGSFRVLIRSTTKSLAGWTPGNKTHTFSTNTGCFTGHVSQKFQYVLTVNQTISSTSKTSTSKCSVWMAFQLFFTRNLSLQPQPTMRWETPCPVRWTKFEHLARSGEVSEVGGFQIRSISPKCCWWNKSGVYQLRLLVEIP